MTVTRWATLVRGVPGAWFAAAPELTRHALALPPLVRGNATVEARAAETPPQALAWRSVSKQGSLLNF